MLLGALTSKYRDKELKKTDFEISIETKMDRCRQKLEKTRERSET